jgi:alkylation response protein AidB-like acyl-CoA dehydrogenase
VDFRESAEHHSLRRAVRELGLRYGIDYFLARAHAHEPPDELWAEAAKLGYLGVNLPSEFGGGGGGITELSIVLEELGAAGCPLLMLVVSPAICGTIIARFGTEDQRARYLPGLADGTRRMAFAITEPDAGSNSHELATVARATADGWLLSGRKIYISGVDAADDALVVARTEDSRTGRLRPALFVVPTAAAGVEWRAIDMELVSPERQFLVYLDDVALPGDARIGGAEGDGLRQLFAGLNPERIMASAFAIGIGRFALDRAVAYVRDRDVWGQPIGAHQGLAHPLAQVKIEIEQARLMMQRAAFLYDVGDDTAAGEAANMAKYAAAEACVRSVDQAVQSLGGHGMATEYALAPLIVAARATRIAPISREMILNFVAQHSLGLPKSY